MSRPPLNPEKTVAGIAIDPRSLERVIPESHRPDGTLRKQIKIRPGFTPQEDVRKFRGTKQAQMDSIALPKGHIIGWTPPPTSTAASGSTTASMSKAAKKNAKRREKKATAPGEGEVKENWDDEDEDEGGSATKSTPAAAATTTNAQVVKPTSEKGHSDTQPNWAEAGKVEEKGKTKEATSSSATSRLLSDALKKLEVK